MDGSDSRVRHSEKGNDLLPDEFRIRENQRRLLQRSRKQTVPFPLAPGRMRLRKANGAQIMNRCDGRQRGAEWEDVRLVVDIDTLPFDGTETKLLHKPCDVLRSWNERQNHGL